VTPPSESERTPVFVVSPVCLYREGLVTMLDLYPSVEVVGAAAHAVSALGAASRVRVVLLDTMSGGCREEIQLLLWAFPDASVVALTVPNRERDALELTEAGATGLVTLDASIDELVAAVGRAARGEAICTPSFTGALMRRLASLAAGRQTADLHASLTLREQEIVDLMEKGLSNKQIAQQLRIQLPTVKNHVHRILAKLGVARRAEVAALARSRVPLRSR
jgi:two-component system nitrate/nitrite response regulator NarL